MANAEKPGHVRAGSTPLTRARSDQ